MSMSVSSRPAGKQYLGNKHKTEVHDPWKETANCQIPEILQGDMGASSLPMPSRQCIMKALTTALVCWGLPALAGVSWTQSRLTALRL